MTKSAATTEEKVPASERDSRLMTVEERKGAAEYSGAAGLKKEVTFLKKSNQKTFLLRFARC